MIVVPTSAYEQEAMALFLRLHAGVTPSADMAMIGWADETGLKMAVAFNAFVGKTCQIHVAMKPGHMFTPKELIKEVFTFAFETANRELLLGIVNSKNTAAMHYDLKLGFKEIMRLEGMHEDGGDIVVLGMKKSECRWLTSKKEHAHAS